MTTVTFNVQQQRG